LLALGIAVFGLRRRIGDGSNDELGGSDAANATIRRDSDSSGSRPSGRIATGLLQLQPQSPAAAVGGTASSGYDAEPLQQQMPWLNSIDGQSSRGGGGDGERSSVASSTAGQSARDGLSGSDGSRSTAVPGLAPAQQQSRLAQQLLPFDDPPPADGRRNTRFTQDKV